MKPIELYHMNDPNNKSKTVVRDSFWSFSYLHGDAEYINEKKAEEEKWEWTAPDLFVAERTPEVDELYIIDEIVTQHNTRRTDPSYPFLWMSKDDDPKEFFENRDFDVYIERKTLWGIPCSLYGNSVIAFILRTQKKESKHYDKEMPEKWKEQRKQRTEYCGRIAVPFTLDESFEATMKHLDDADYGMVDKRPQSDKEKNYIHAQTFNDWM